MAAIYDQQGNYVGDDGAPSLDQMKLELVKKNQPLSAQIPGYDRPVPPAQTKPDPLGSAAGNFTELATKFNPLMMAKSMQEMAGILTVPAVAALKGVGESLTTSPSGTYTSGQAPKYAAQVAKQFMEANAPQTPLTQEFAGAIAPVMENLPAYLGHLQTGRPAFTPNDLRVMGAEATRVGRQVRDIPTDFYNAQSGLQKLDPITGQPTMGAKLQGVAESVGDIMAQREMQGLPPIPGLPASMQPMNPKLYAMRPEGSRLTSAVVPETAKGYATSYAPAQDLVGQVIDSATITPAQALEEIQGKILRVPEASSARNAFVEFIKQKATEMYPDAPTTEGAVAAYKAKFGNKEASAAHTLGMYDEFLQTPEGIQYRAELDLPSADELYARHEAAANWLNSQFTNYILEKIGTPNEPAAKLASQGLTFMEPERVHNLADASDRVIGAARTKAGMPARTATDEALSAAQQKLVALQQQAATATTYAREQQAAGLAQGYGAIDPNTGRVVEGMNIGRYEPFAQAQREANKAADAYKKQRQVVDNLQLGAAYENAIDRAIDVSTAQDLRNQLEYSEQQFYPSLMRTPDAERVYTASTRRLRNLGFEDLARKFYNDVMSGKIPLDKVPKTTVEKYMRATAEERIAAEKAKQAKVAQYKNAVDTQFKASADAHIPNDKVFGNVGALEITNRFTPEEVAKLVSEDTTALDVCIGEGGSAHGTPNYWHPGTGNRQYEPIYNVATGEKNPNATSPRTTFINAVRDGSQMVSFRDTATGEPVAIFDFNPSSLPGKYNINFASGRKNGDIKPEYIDGIKSYLNSRADSIHDVGTNLYSHTGITDSERTANHTLAGMIDMRISQFARYDLSNLPRFFTRTDLRNYIENLKANEPAAQTPAVTSQRPSESVEAYASGAVSSAIDNTLDAQRRQLTDAGEENYIPTAEMFFEDIRGYFNAYLDSQGPARALELTTNRLLDLEPDYANSNRIGANIIADGMVELMHTLGLQAEYVQNRMAAEATGQRPDYLRMTHDAALDLDRARGEEAGNDLRTVFRTITETLGVDPAQNTDRFIHELRIAASAAPRDSVGVVLNELADQMESAYMRDWEPEVAHPAGPMPDILAPEQRAPQFGDAEFDNFVADIRANVDAQVAHDIVRISNVVADGMGTNIRGALSLRPALFAERLADQAELAENFMLEQALNDLAIQIAPDVPPAAQQPPTEEAAAMQWMQTQPRGELVNHIEPGRWAIINADVDSLQRQLQAGQLDPDTVVADIREGRMPQVTNGLSFFEREIIARDVNDYLALNTPRGREAGQAPVRSPEDAQFTVRALARDLIDDATAGNGNIDAPAINAAIRNLEAGTFVDPQGLLDDISNLPGAERLAMQRRIANDIRTLLRLREGEQFEPARDVEDYRTAAEDILTVLEENYYTDMPSPRDAIRLVRQHLRALRRNGEMAFENIMGDAAEAYEWSPELLHALEVELEDLIERYQALGDGHADGGPIRGYQKGGSVKKTDVPTPWLFSVPTYSETVAYEMYPGQKGQDDQRDAARHMLAAGTLSRKYGPGVAEFMGKAHEFTTSPLQAVKSVFGGKMPADYGMDTHNNTIGAQLGQRAKSQAELEDLVQAEAERASRTQTPGQAFIKRANGGIVQQNPTTDQMRYALMMRKGK